MWNYEKRLQYPVRIKKPDGMAAKIIITQFGGPDGELAASQRYLSQRYSMPYGDVAGLLTDIGTEEYAPIGYQGYSVPLFASFAFCADSRRCNAALQVRSS